MKRMKYCGTYVVLPGDIFVFHNNGKSIITEREVRKQKMSVVKVPWMRSRIQHSWNELEILRRSNLRKEKTKTRKTYCRWLDYIGRELLEEQIMKNYFMLDGKKIPMSNETADSLREKQKPEVPPMVRKAYFCGADRLVLRLSDRMKASIAEHPEATVFGFSSDGALYGFGSDAIDCYDNDIVTLFRGDVK